MDDSFYGLNGQNSRLRYQLAANVLRGQLQQQGYSLIPLSVYLKGSLVKVSLAVAKGKKLYDKRDDIAKRDSQRNIDRIMKDRRNAN